MSRFTLVQGYNDYIPGAMAVTDQVTGRRFPPIWTPKQAEFVARYLNDVDSGLIVLNPLR